MASLTFAWLLTPLLTLKVDSSVARSNEGIMDGEDEDVAPSLESVVAEGACWSELLNCIVFCLGVPDAPLAASTASASPSSSSLGGRHASEKAVVKSSPSSLSSLNASRLLLSELLQDVVGSGEEGRSTVVYIVPSRESLAPSVVPFTATSGNDAAITNGVGVSVNTQMQERKYILHCPIDRFETLAAAKLTDAGAVYASSTNNTATASLGNASVGNSTVKKPSTSTSNRDRLTRYGRLRALVAGEILGALCARMLALVSADTSPSHPARPLSPLPPPSLLTQAMFSSVQNTFSAAFQSAFILTTTAALARCLPSAAPHHHQRHQHQNHSPSCDYGLRGLRHVVERLATELSSNSVMYSRDGLREMLLLNGRYADDDDNVFEGEGSKSDAFLRASLPLASHIAPSLADPSSSAIVSVRSAMDSSRGGVKGEVKIEAGEEAGSATTTDDGRPSKIIVKEEPTDEADGGIQAPPLQQQARPRKVLSLKSRAVPAAAVTSPTGITTTADGAGNNNGARESLMSPPSFVSEQRAGDNTPRALPPSLSSSQSSPSFDAHLIRHHLLTMLVVLIDQQLSVIASGVKEGGEGNVSERKMLGRTHDILNEVFGTIHCNDVKSELDTKEGAAAWGEDKTALMNTKPNALSPKRFASCLSNLLSPIIRAGTQQCQASCRRSQTLPLSPTALQSSSLSVPSLLSPAVKAFVRRLYFPPMGCDDSGEKKSIDEDLSVAIRDVKDSFAVGESTNPLLASCSSRSSLVATAVPIATEVTLLAKSHANDAEYQAYVRDMNAIRKEVIDGLWRAEWLEKKNALNEKRRAMRMRSGGAKKTKKKAGAKRGRAKKGKRGGKKRSSDGESTTSSSSDSSSSSSGSSSSSSDEDDADAMLDGYDTDEEAAFCDKHKALIDQRVKTLIGTRERRTVNVQVVFASTKEGVEKRGSNHHVAGDTTPQLLPSNNTEKDDEAKVRQKAAFCASPHYKCIVFRHVGFKRRARAGGGGGRGGGPSHVSSNANANNKSAAPSPTPPPLAAPLAAYDVCYPVSSFVITPSHLQPLMRWEKEKDRRSGVGVSGKSYDYHVQKEVTVNEWLKEGGYVPPSLLGLSASSSVLAASVIGSKRPRDCAALDAASPSVSLRLKCYSVSLSVDPLLRIPLSAPDMRSSETVPEGRSSLVQSNPFPNAVAQTGVDVDGHSGYIQLDTALGELVTTELFFAVLVPIGVQWVDRSMPTAATAGNGGYAPCQTAIVDPSAFLEMLPPVPPLPVRNPNTTTMGLASSSKSHYHHHHAMSADMLATAARAVCARSQYKAITLPYSVRYVAEGRRRNDPSTVTRQTVRVFEVENELLPPFTAAGSSRHEVERDASVSSPYPTVGMVIPVATMVKVCGALRKALLMGTTRWAQGSQVSSGAGTGAAGLDAIYKRPFCAERGRSQCSEDLATRLLRQFATTFQVITNAQLQQKRIAASEQQQQQPLPPPPPMLPPPIAERVAALAAMATNNQPAVVVGRTEDASLTVPLPLLPINAPVYNFLFGEILDEKASDLRTVGDGIHDDAGAIGAAPSAAECCRAFVDVVLYSVMTRTLAPCLAARLSRNGDEEDGEGNISKAANGDGNGGNGGGGVQFEKRTVLKLGSRFKSVSDAQPIVGAESQPSSSLRPAVLPPPVRSLRDEKPLCTLLSQALQRIRALPIGACVRAADGGGGGEGRQTACTELQRVLRQVASLSSQLASCSEEDSILSGLHESSQRTPFSPLTSQNNACNVGIVRCSKSSLLDIITRWLHCNV